MAEKEDLDLDVKPASNKKLIIIIAVVGILLIGASVGLTLWLVGGSGGKTEAQSVEASKPQAEYLALDTMVVNFAQRGPARFLQVDIQLMAHDAQVLQAVEQHMPVIRNDILVMLGSQSYDSVSTREGKEKLRGEILATVNRILKEQAGQGEIQAVYFTNFVMQ
jgi:flagellar FliL protein